MSELSTNSTCILNNLATVGDNIPTVFQTIGLALLGILIPLTIAVLQDLMQKKKKNDTNFSILDMHVILDCVFHTKRLTIISVLIFVPFIFWDFSNWVLRLITIATAAVGSSLIIGIILRGYRWTKGSVMGFRTDYLKKYTKKEDLLPVWKSVWDNPDMTFFEETEFLDIFDSAVKRFIEA